MMQKFGTALRVLLLALIIVALVAPLGASRAQAQAGSIATVNTPKLNIRNGPGAGYAVLGTVSQGSTITLLGRNADSSWAFIRTASLLEGWSSTLFLTTTIQLSSLPVLGTGTTVEPTASVIVGSLNVRSGPGTNYPVLLTVGTGHVMSMLGRNNDGSWVMVRVNGVVGWVNESSIVPQSPIMSLPNTSGSVAPPPTAQPPASNPPGSLPGGIPDGNVAPGTAVVTAGLLNMRSGPGPGYSVVGKLANGTLVTMLGRNSAGSWILVSSAGLQGWVSSLYLQIAGPPVEVPILAEAEPTAVVTTGAINVRSGPGTTFAVITTAPYGTIVNMLARNGNATWVQIRVNGVVGWVDALYLSTGYNLWYLPLGTTG